MEEIKILYEDEYLIICVKPRAVLSQRDESGDPCMTELLEKLYLERGKRQYIGLVHRLDRNVSGVMLFSKRKDITGKLSELIKNRDFTKEYLAVVQGIFEDKSGSMEDILFFDRFSSKTFAVDRERKGAKKASLDFSVIGEMRTDKGDFSLVKVRLNTGRTHQIRAQFSKRNHPIAGDGKYGSKINCQIDLFSYRLSFIHPVTKKTVDVSYAPDFGDFPVPNTKPFSGPAKN